MADIAIPASRTTAAPPTAGTLHGVLLCAMSCLAVLGAVLLSPVLTKMEDAFAGTAGVDILVPVTLTVPALMIGLLAPLAGSVIDRVDRKRLLIAALVVYGFVGMAPLFLSSLPLIVVTRVGVGITEAAIMTCCTTLIVDYFDGPARAKWLGMQTVMSALAATVFFAVGGALGSFGWRAPFWLYAVAFPMALLAAKVVFQPAKSVVERNADLPPFPFKVLLVPVLVTVFGGIVFYAPIVEVSYRLDDIGISSSGVVGIVGAAASLSTAIGGMVFGRLTGVSTRSMLTTAFTLAGLGLMIFAVANPVPVIIAGVILACAGTGLMLPSLLTWAVSTLDFDERGRGTGLWTAALFIGDFLCPLIVIGLTAALGGLTAALVALGGLSLVMVPVTRTLLRGRANVTPALINAPAVG